MHQKKKKKKKKSVKRCKSVRERRIDLYKYEKSVIRYHDLLEKKIMITNDWSVIRYHDLLEKKIMITNDLFLKRRSW